MKKVRLIILLVIIIMINFGCNKEYTCTTRITSTTENIYGIEETKSTSVEIFNINNRKEYKKYNGLYNITTTINVDNGIVEKTYKYTTCDK